MQREYSELYNFHSEQLGDELSLLEKHGIIQDKIGMSPIWTIIMDMLMNPNNYETDIQLQIIPEFRQGK